MSVDLHDLFQSALDDGEREFAGTAPQGGAVAAWEAEGRRRRGRRTMWQVAAAVPFVAAAGVAAHFAVTQAGGAFAPAAPTQTMTTVPGLPPHYVTDGDPLSLARPGWLLAAYEPATMPGETEERPAAFFLGSPDGDLYRIDDVSSAGRVDVHDWQAGDERALVRTGFAASGEGFGAELGWLDLRTGDIESLGLRDMDRARYVGRSAAGEFVLVGSSLSGPVGGVVRIVTADGDERLVELESAAESAVLNPSGTRLLVSTEGGEYASVDLTREGLQVPHFVKAQGDVTSCWEIGWLDDDTFLSQCVDEPVDDTNPPESFTAVRTRVGDVGGSTLDGTPVEPFVRIEPGAAHVADGVLAARVVREAGEEGAPCTSQLVSWRDSALTFGPTAADLAGSVHEVVVDGGALVLDIRSTCTNASDQVSSVVRMDPATGETRTLVPTVDGAAGGREGGVVGWTVGR